MGNAKSTRKIIIAKDNEDNLIVLNKSAFDKLNNAENVQKEEPKSQLQNKPVVETDNNNDRDLIISELNYVKEQNEVLWKVANDKLVNDIDKLELNYLKFKHSKICEEYEKFLEDCYKNNSRKPLNCSILAKEFYHCVNNSRKIIFNKNI